MNQQKAADKNSSQNSIVIGFLILGLLLFGASLYLSTRPSADRDQSIRVGRVSRETGTVVVIRDNYTKKEKVERQTSVYTLDSVETNDTGEALISFENLFSVRILDSSFVTIEKTGEARKDQVVLIVKKGEIKVENFGREGELLIAKNGQRVAAESYNASDLQEVVVVTSPTPDLNSKPTSLTEEEISTIMSGQASLFKRCYTQLLQKDEKAQGTVTLNFSIENNGKISETTLDSPQIQNEVFKKCILDVIGRVAFRNYSGPPISTRYPLKFE